MEKHEHIMRVSSLVMAAASTDAERTNFFANMKHSELVERFIIFLDFHKEHIRPLQASARQALNDRGVDILIEGDNCKIGIQIKSEFDAKEENFAGNVKRQMSESLAHGLDKWFLLICCPVTLQSKLDGRVSHLLNEMSTFKTDYFCSFGPRSLVNIFEGPQSVSDSSVEMTFKRMTYRPTSAAELAEALKEQPIERTILKDKAEESGKPALTLKTLNSSLWGLNSIELADSKKSVDKYFDLLSGVPRLTREYYLKILERAEYRETGIVGGHRILLREAVNWIKRDETKILDEITILESRQLAYIDEDEGAVFICLRTPMLEFSVPEEIKKFCKSSGIKLKEVICDLKFDLLD